MKKVLILFFLASCVSHNPDSNLSKKKLNFNDNFSFEDFNTLLIEYAMTSPYPNIDE